MIKPELDRYIAGCNFTRDEMKIFERRCKGDTIEQIAEAENMSTSTCKRILSKITKKMKKLDQI